MNTTEIIARLVTMIVMVGAGGYAFVAGILLCRFYFVFGSGNEGFLPLISSVIGAVLIYFGFYLSPFEIVTGVR